MPDESVNKNPNDINQDVLYISTGYLKNLIKKLLKKRMLYKLLWAGEKKMYK